MGRCGPWLVCFVVRALNPSVLAGVALGHLRRRRREPVGLNGELELHRRLPWRRPVRLVLMWSMAKASVDDPWRAFADEEVGGRELNAMPRYRAEDLIYEAWEVTGPRRTKLARQALELSPDCADAYVLLAQAASDLDGARELLEKGALLACGRWGAECLKTTPMSSG